jgi:hypothetical protein
LNHQAAIRQLANRLVGILHGCLKAGILYVESAAWTPNPTLARTEAIEPQRVRVPV